MTSPWQGRRCKEYCGRQTAKSAIMVERRLGDAAGSGEGIRIPTRDGFRIRTHEPGDLGWIVSRHGALYVQEHGWDPRFEGLVAQIAAEFLAHYDPSRDRCFVAELDGERVGSAAVVHAGDGSAKLRVLLVEPQVRGKGIGSELVRRCVRFAWEAGYSRLVLWTVSSLDAARRIYERHGFKLVGSSPHAQFVEGLEDQTWELELLHGDSRTEDNDS